MIDDGGVGGYHGSGLLMWVCGGGSGGGGQRAEGSGHGGGLVVLGLFGYFLMGLWLDICWVCGGFGVMMVAMWW